MSGFFEINKIPSWGSASQQPRKTYTANKANRGGEYKNNDVFLGRGIHQNVLFFLKIESALFFHLFFTSSPPLLNFFGGFDAN